MNLSNLSSEDMEARNFTTKPMIAELERILDEDDTKQTIEILPNGEIRSVDLLQTNDAAVWAAEFERCKRKNGWTIDDIDEGLMIGWFANAMAAQEFSERTRNAPQRKEEEKAEAVGGQYVD